MRSAIIIAHPDDETIWSGGLILCHPQWDWTVLSLCRSDDPDRRGRFENVCKAKGITGLISDLDDGDPPAPIRPGGQIAGRIMQSLAAAAWDLCITHGRNGEYGHRRHREVHAEVVALVRDGLLKCKELWTFAYDCDGATGACTPSCEANFLLDLTDQELAEKKRIIRQEYGYDDDSFEVTACVSPECFKRPSRPQEKRRSNEGPGAL
jgi:LmbE family N-acetylglucosaminyl deacetylase